MILSDIAEVIMGQAPPGNSYNENEEGCPLLAGASDLGAVFPSPSRHTSKAKKVSKLGDVILCVRATIGKLNWSDGSYCLGRGVAGIRAFDNNDSDFLFYFLAANEEYLLSKGRGATFKQISKSDIVNLEIPEKAYKNKSAIIVRIQECLSRVEEMEGLKKELEIDASAVEAAFLRELEESICNSPVPVGTVLQDTRNGRSPEAKRKNHNCSVLTLTAVQNVMLDHSCHKGIEQNNEEQEKFRISEGEVYISRANTIELVGLSSFVGNAVDEVITFPDLLIRLTPIQDKILPSYLALSLRFPSSRKQIQERSIGSSRSMVKISGARLKEVEIPVPSIKEQAAVFDKYMRFSQAAKEMRDISNADFSGLRNAILRQAFAGEL